MSTASGMLTGAAMCIFCTLLHADCAEPLTVIDGDTLRRRGAGEGSTIEEEDMNTRLRYHKGYQFLDHNGAPLANGKLYYYEAGTNILQDTFSDSEGMCANANPVPLNEEGRLATDVYLSCDNANYTEILTKPTFAPVEA